MAEDPNDPSLHAEAVSLLLDFVPVVGSGKSAVELVSGKDYITGQKVNRWLAAGGIILGLVPFGKLLTKGKKAINTAEHIAAKIAYDAPSKAALVQRMEKVIPTATKEVEKSFILQEIKKVDPTVLKEKFGVHFNPLDSRSDMNLVNQYLVQLQHGGHAAHKHWISGGKKDLLQHLTPREVKKVTKELDDADEVFAYLKIILKDTKTVKVNLPTGQRVGFANAEKKVLIIHNPNHQGTFYYKADPISELHSIYEKDFMKLSGHIDGK